MLSIPLLAAHVNLDSRTKFSTLAKGWKNNCESGVDDHGHGPGPLSLSPYSFSRFEIRKNARSVKTDWRDR